MSYKPDYRSGEWKVACDQCGRIYRSHMLSMRWDGLMVCPEDWEPRQPQDFVKAVADEIAPPWTRPEQADIFIGPAVPPTCTVWGSLGIAGIAVAGCAIAGVTTPPLNSFLYNNS